MLSGWPLPGGVLRTRLLALALVIGALLSGGVVAAVAHDGSRADTAVAAVAGAGGTITSPLAWRSCWAAQCATLTVSLDWSGRDRAAHGRTVGIALLRYRATGGTSQRLGSLVVDPGGPGESGVDFVRDHVATLPPAVRARFDIVGFDPRGTGASMPVHCLSGPALDQLVALPPYPVNATEQAELVAGSRQESDACARALGPALRHLATVDVARDLDAIRGALGDRTLSYLGYSYGTAIGAAYADAFPTHIRALVLDGALDPRASGTDILTGQATGFETAFNAFAAWCVGNKRCPFGADTASVAALQHDYDTLVASVRADPLLVGTRAVDAGEFSLGVFVTLYSKTSGWPVLGYALAQAKSGDGSTLLQLADSYVERDANGHYSALEEANLAVNCTDRPWPRDPSAYASLAAKLAGRDPRFGRTVAWSGLGCATWRADPVSTPHAVHAPKAPAILVVGTTRDPATPYSSAVALAKQLDHGVLLSYHGDGHTAYRDTGSGCVKTIVDAYLIGLTTPSRWSGASC